MDKMETLILIPILLWVLPWKGIALWKAARNGHKKWFIALLVVNTLAILDIIYIFYFAKRNNPNVTNSYPNDTNNS
jgi:hypothetical protein